MNLAQIVQSHALSFFHLSSPDLLFGFDAEAGGRHLFGVLGANPQLAHDGIGLRRFGQQVIESLGGKRIHPGWVVPGGVASPLETDTRAQILAALPELAPPSGRGWYKASVRRFAEERPASATSLGVHGPGRPGRPGRALRRRPPGRRRRRGGAGRARRPRPYWEYLGEAVEPWSYLKSAYWKDLGYPDGVYRVGPLARLNVADRLGTPEADEQLEELRGRLGRTPSSSFHYHHARLIEILHCLERMAVLLEDPDILSTRVRSVAGINRDEGIGVAEAHGARSCATTGSTATASSSGPTWSSPPATTTWP